MKKILPLLPLLILFACGPKNQIEITSRNFGEEIETQQNLVFIFNKELVPDSLIGIWDTTQFIKITPEVRGKFRWNSNKELVFSPQTGFKAATEYKANLSSNLRNYTGQRFSVDEKRSFLFHTAYPRLLQAENYWDRSESGEGAIALNIALNFNYKIKPEVLLNIMKLELDGKNYAYRIINNEISNRIQLQIDKLPGGNFKSQTLKISISPGLKCIDSDYSTSTSQEMSVIIPSPDRIEIIQAEASYDGPDPAIRVYTTQGVEENGLKKLIRLEPEVKNFSLEILDNGFFIHGNFTAGNSYSLTIDAPLKGILGGATESAYSTTVLFGELEPSISFAGGNGMYLSTQSSKNVAIHIVNIPKIRVSIYKIYENNILQYLNHNRYRNYYYEDEDDYGEASSGDYNYQVYDMDKYSNRIFQREYETRNLAMLNGKRLLNLDIDQMDSFKGIYLVSVNSTDKQWQRSIKLISVSDLGIISKVTSKNAHVFINSISGASPVSGAQVSFISTNNQVLGTVNTTADGTANLLGLDKKYPDFSLSMITVRKGDDFNYLFLGDSRVNSSRFDVGGRRSNESGYMAFIYGDRDIYRPGESINLNTVLRSEKWVPLANAPVKVRILRPDGKEFRSFKGMLNSQGSFALKAELPESALTGNYVAEVLSGNDVLLNSKNISVEEFMPDRIDVNVNLNKTFYKSNDSISLNLSAVNYFGPPAADRKYEINYVLRIKDFQTKNFRGYNFNLSLSNEKRELPSTLREGKTDANGKAKEIFYPAAPGSDLGILSGKFFVTVFDENGRPVHRQSQFDIYTQDVFYGIFLDDYYVNTTQALDIPLVACNKEGKSISAPAHVQLIRNDYYTVIQRNEYGSLRYVSQRKETILLDKTMNLTSDGGKLNYYPRESGEYELRISRPGSDSYVSSSFYAYRSGYTASSAFKVNTEGTIDIGLDQENYEPGNTAKVIFKTPFAGRMLVTVEGDELLEYYYIDTDKKSALLELPVKSDYQPNVYITATLFRPLDNGSIPMTVAHGFVPLQVLKKNTRLPVEISVAEKSRSNTKQNIRIKTAPNSQLTISVVDEGILALKSFVTPDPHAYFYQKKALGTQSYNLYDRILPDLRLKRSTQMGDEGTSSELGKRKNPFSNKRVKPLAIWSGILNANAQGEVNFSADIPSFSGDVRIMACVYKDNNFGNASKNMKVADPIVISSGIPRVLSPQDTLLMPVTLTNTTNKQSEASVLLKLSGPLQLSGGNIQRVQIPANSEAKVFFKIAALSSVGESSIQVTVKAFEETFSESVELSVRPPSGLLKASGSGVLKGGTSESISAKVDFIPSTTKGKLVISRNPVVQLSNQLSELLGYPYGCLEQTVSKAFPQMYYSELVKNVKKATQASSSPTENVQAAIRKVESMQLYNGSYSYWPGGTYENTWATNFAAHFLLEAQKAGFDVNLNNLERTMNYLSMKGKSRDTTRYYYLNEQNIITGKTIINKDIIYSLYLTALYRKADLGSMNYFKSNSQLLATDSKYLLACTYKLIGDNNSFRTLLPSTLENEKSLNMSGGSFSSYIRDEAFVLNILLESDPDNPQIGIMVQHLSAQMNQARRSLNTQENAFAFLALGKFMKKQSQSTATVKITSNGTEVANFTGEEIVLSNNLFNKKLECITSGIGNVYYYWEAEGLGSSIAQKDEDSYLRIRKKHYNRFGQPVDLNQVKQGDLIVVQLSLSNDEKSQIDNVVVTDILPAGFEIENPRLSETEEFNWIKNSSQPEYLDIRDDRIHYFTSAGKDTRNFYYVVRAVSTGKFIMGAASADAMYNSSYRSYNGAGRVRIQ